MTFLARRATPLLLLAVVLAVGLGPLTATAADAATSAPHAPTAPADPEPRPEPTPGPTPAPGRPSPAPERPRPAEPRPGPTPPACEATGTKCEKATGGWWDLFDIPGMIVNAMTAFLGMLVEQVMKPVRELLADTQLSTPDVTRQADVRRLWTGSLGIAAGIYVLFVTAGGLTVMGYETFQTRYALKQIAPRLLVGMIAAATSLTVMGKAISLANALSHAVMRTDTSDAGKGLVERVIPFALFGSAGLNLYLLVLAIIMVVLALAVLIGYIVRVAVIALLAVSAPLALSCHAHPITDSLARMWWRALAGCLTIQVAQSMTLVVALKLFFAPGATLLGFPKPSQLGTMLAGLALFWFLFKIPGWCLRSVFRSSPVSLQAPAPLRMLQSVAMWRLMNRAVPGLGTLRHAGTGHGRGGGGGGPGGRPGGRGAPPGGPRGGGGQGGGGRPGGGRSPGRPPGPGGVAGFAVRRGRALVAGVRARAAVVATAAGAAAGGQPAAPAGPSPARHGGAPAGSSRTPGGPRSVIHPVQARRRQQLALPIPANRVPARPGRPAQLRLPITVQRVPRTATVLPGGVPSTGPGVPGTPPRPATAPPAAASPTRRSRQLALPVPAARVRRRPTRPAQLRLPLEPPAPPAPRR
ncbi:hypothetical protein [Streptomyces kaempferi]|uniref:hypothetical protein n=1 Tax=Streptomyces kaempferi TaxID=333725 RepID=UPI003620360E